jgi:uncharacterized repeat protein (TIGR03803 family)
MRGKSLARLMVAALTLFGFGSIRAAVVENVIYYFNGQDGANPYNGVILKGGNLYGVTYGGGLYGSGTVFELAPNGTAWTETVLYNFTGGADGSLPFADLTFDNAGNFYGTTLYGGTHGGGVVFELSPTSQGGWAETVLISFPLTRNLQSVGPNSVIFKGGKLYGSINFGGTHGYGAVFELFPTKVGWTKSILYNFAGGSDGGNPSGRMAFDAAGNLYGTAESAGVGFGARGLVFELTPLNGSWTRAVLYTFQCCNGDGLVPSGLTIDHAGNLYGTTSQGGTGICAGFNGCGTVWELSLSGTTWVETVLHEFAGGSDGNWPNSNLLVDRSGIFGTTRGLISGDTTVFHLKPSNQGWTNTVLLDAGVGNFLYAGVIRGPASSLYGTFFAGGQNYGYVFQLSP